jgi:uncharacterized membrane protein YgdD (TMEM256/DUF423 family)
LQIAASAVIFGQETTAEANHIYDRLGGPWLTAVRWGGFLLRWAQAPTAADSHRRSGKVTGKWIAIAGALLAAAGVALGAFGAHGLEKQLQSLGREANLAQRMAWFDTGVRYHMYHALALVVVAALARTGASNWHTMAAAAFLLGVALFSGSLYAMTFGEDSWRKLGAVTPLGGLAFLVGWVCVAVAAWRSS